MVNLLNVLRWKNLCGIAIIVLCLKYFVFENLIELGNYPQFVSNFSFVQTLLLIVSIVFIAGGGYVIRALNDIESDNNTDSSKTILLNLMSEQKALTLYALLSIGGIAIGVYLSLQFHFYQLAFFHLLSAALLWIYASYFKSSVLIGNIIIAFLAALIPLFYFCFEAYAYLFSYGAIFQELFHSFFYEGPLLQFWWYCLSLAFFIFSFQLIHEIIKDLEDFESDKMVLGKTLPMAVGSTNARWILRVLLIGEILLLLYFNYGKIENNPFKGLIFQSYFYLTILLPSILVLLLTFKKEVDYKQGGSLIKIILLFGILSTYIFHTLL